MQTNSVRFGKDVVRLAQIPTESHRSTHYNALIRTATTYDDIRDLTKYLGEILEPFLKNLYKHYIGYTICQCRGVQIVMDTVLYHTCTAVGLVSPLITYCQCENSESK